MEDKLLMKKFVEFAKDILSNTYENILTSLINSHVPAAIFSLNYDEEKFKKQADTLKNYGINMQYIITLNDDNFDEEIETVEVGGGGILLLI